MLHIDKSGIQGLKTLTKSLGEKVQSGVQSCIWRGQVTIQIHVSMEMGTDSHGGYYQNSSQILYKNTVYEVQ